jgi:lipopolysaccharide export LptBFGC system permease protein LptF
LKELATEIVSQTKNSADQIQNYLKDRTKVLKDFEDFKKNYSLNYLDLSREEILKKTSQFESNVNIYKNELDAIDKNIDNYRRNLPYTYIMKYYEKFALPMASLAFALISLSIGMFTARSGRNEGLGLSIIIMLVFYGLKVGTETLIQKQDLPPIMEWFPNTLFMMIGLVLLTIKIRE